ncbi:MAG TPA: sugar phosphate isomerase/epimerase family protein [Burkholderiales bacterium]|nr:sugar phosphate isomerase/epimerase family protein [Burkholderiales bacterium]
MQSLAGRLERCAINTATLGHQLPIEQMIDAVARAGFGAIAAWRQELQDRRVEVIGRRIRDAGLKVSGLCRSTFIPAPTRALFLANIEDNRHAIDQAAALEAACFVVVGGGLAQGSKDLAGARAQLGEGLALLLEHARSAGVPLALEALHPMYCADRSCLSTLEQALDLCEVLDSHRSGALGVAVDVYHVWWDPKLEAQIERAGQSQRLLAFHVCDWLVPTRDLLLDRGMMGDGVIELHRIRGWMERSGYADAVEVEIFSRDNWWKRPVSETLEVCAERLQTVC